jgi:hypothetical protein
MFRESDEREPKGGPRKGKGRRGGPLKAGPEGNCLCPNCNHRVPHERGEPCMDRKCPKCGTRMVRE